SLRDRRAWRCALVRVLPAVALVVGYASLRTHLLGGGTFHVADWQGGNAHTGSGRGLGTQLSTMAVLLPRALGQVLVPIGLTMDPQVHYRHDCTEPAVLCGALLIGVLTVVGLAAPRRRPLRFLGTCLAWGCALPWVVKPLNLPYLEHRMYGPLAGLALVAAASLPRLAARLRGRQPASRAILALLLATFTIAAARRSVEFASQETLWRVELARNPDSQVALAGLAVCSMESGRFAEARPLLCKLVALHPERRDSRLNLAEVELQCGAEGDPALADRHAAYLVQTWPRNPFYRLLRSRTLAALAQRTGDASGFDRAVAQALSCLEIATPKALVFRTAATARMLQGDFAAALELLEEGVRRGLGHADLQVQRSEVLRRLGRVAEARNVLLRARARDPFHGGVLAALAAIERAAPPR
ncbi:MAG: tetratricopeptide repeat protein, partial [Planctomycetes bacterium]|nr:tetratricopeptide repeat protein [Planctomycetota bacterium]